MIENEGTRNDAAKVGVPFGVRGRTLVPQFVTTLLGIPATRQFSKGDAYNSRSGPMARPFGLWAIDSDSLPDSDSIEEHEAYILQQLEPRRQQIRNLRDDETLRVFVAIWWEPEGGQGGFTRDAATIIRLASLANEVDFYFA